MKRLAHFCVTKKENYIWSDSQWRRERRFVTPGKFRAEVTQIFSNLCIKIPKRINWRYRSIYLLPVSIKVAFFISVMNNEIGIIVHIQMKHRSAGQSVLLQKVIFSNSVRSLGLMSREWINVPELLCRSLSLPCAFSLHAQNLCQLR